MKKHLMPLIAGVILCASIAGCQKTESLGPVDPPEELTEYLKRQEKGKTTEAAEDTRVDLYYDNTQYMKNYRGGTKFDKFLRALENTNEDYDYTPYILQNHNNKEYMIKEYEGSVYEDYWEDDFYTASTVEVASFFYQEPQHPESINVYVTDLEEFQVPNTQLANNLNKKVLFQKGYSACIIAAVAEYKGTQGVAVNGTVKEIKVDDTKPFYLVLTGRDEELMKYIKAFVQNLGDQSLYENDDYYISYYRPNKTVAQAEFEDLLTSEIAAEYDKHIKKEEWNSVILNSNMGVTACEVDEVLDSDEKLDVLAFRYDGKNSTKSGRMVINYYIPLEKVTWENWSYRDDAQLYATASLEKETSGDADFDRVYDQRELFSAYTCDTTKTASLSGGEEDDEDEDDDIWETLSYNKFSKYFTVSEPKIIRAGTEVYDIDVTENPDLADGAKYEPKFLFTAETDMIQITVESKENSLKAEWDTILFNLPIYAYVEPEIEIPSWVTVFERKDALQLANTTSNVKAFYESLFSIKTTADANLIRESRLTKIADVTTVLTGIPEK